MRMSQRFTLADLPTPRSGPQNGGTGWPWREVEPVDSAGSQATAESWPRITIVTPSYNQGAYLEATIRSVLAQGYPNLEYFILDGGSTDGSVEIIRHYEPWIDWWVSEPDEGQAAAINRGLGRATSDILAWLNSDDLYCPDTLWVVAAAFREQPARQLVYGEGWYVDEQGQAVQPCHFVRRQFTRTYLVNKDPILQPAAFWRRELWEAVGPLNRDLHWVFDWEWFIRAHQKATFHYLPRVLAYYRLQPEAKTRVGGLKRQLEHGRVTRRYGAWWHPNHMVQQTRRLAAAGERLTERWPGWLGWPLRVLASLPRLTAERLLHGMYMN